MILFVMAYFISSDNIIVAKYDLFEAMTNPDPFITITTT